MNKYLDLRSKRQSEMTVQKPRGEWGQRTARDESGLAQPLGSSSVFQAPLATIMPAPRGWQEAPSRFGHRDRGASSCCYPLPASGTLPREAHPECFTPPPPPGQNRCALGHETRSPPPPPKHLDCTIYSNNSCLQQLGIIFVILKFLLH